MTAPIVTFSNNKGGVGKTSLVYHLAWMLADLGHRVVAADLDPQANLTSAFLDEREIEDVWANGSDRATVWGSIRPFHEGESAIVSARAHQTGDDRLVLLAGDLELSSFEDDLSGAWPECLDGKPRAFRVMSAFWRVLNDAASSHEADVVLVDVGPSLGAINRGVLVASDHVVLPVAPDLFSLQGLRNLGPTLAGWRSGWAERRKHGPPDLAVPAGDMAVVGYVVMGHAVRLDRPVKAYQRWLAEIPGEFRGSVLRQATEQVPAPETDPYCLAQLKHYRSLMPLAQEARKPMFALKPADGAFGGHYQAAQSAYVDFRALATVLTDRLGLTRPG
ncbi:MAG: AAA family ATPase [Actinophytocola sp.]|uniref:ParA family protein n=1 Tax=Actinophytocola sp. TaxID=1872138 RepID=UPI00132BEE91|nr:ParA family protein [Actinophytocola sp.]MPZ85628.1 AAA family ATPase [Actinophytocola sp.]